MKQLFTILILCLSFNAFCQTASYSFNNGTANDEVGTAHGTVNGATPTSDRFGNANHAYYFDGVDDFINFGDEPAFQMGTNDFAISLWIKTDSIVPKSCILGKINPSSMLNYNQYSIWYNNTSGLINTNCKDDGTSSETTGSNDIDTTGWNHIVLLHGNDSLTGYTGSILYINNVAVDTVISGVVNGDFDISGYSLVMGRRNTQADFHFRGVVDDLNIYQNGLTLQQIDSLYNAPNPVVSNIETLSENQMNTRLHPNPTSNILNIQHTTQFFNQVEIISIDGRIQSFNFGLTQEHQLNLQDLQSGLYFLRIWSDGELVDVQKFSKQ